MGFRDKIVNKAADNINEKSSELFKRIIEIQESLHAHLEKLLECQRAMLDEVKAIRKEGYKIPDAKLCIIEYKDEAQ